MKAIIVGGGIAGLSAGVYASQSGFDVTIFESHSIPGGNATDWKRKGYFFEGGLHWLIGSKEKTPLHALFKEIGALQENNPIHVKDPFLTYMGKRKKIYLYRNLEKLRQHLEEISPEDKAAIDELVKDAKIMSKMSMPIVDSKGVKVKKKARFPLSMLLALPKALPLMKKLGKITAKEYAGRFKNPDIASLLRNLIADDGFQALPIAATLGSLSIGDGGYPDGGALRLAGNIADEFARLGGKIEYNAMVEKIHIQNGKAAGVVIGGLLHTADAVIVTLDTRKAIDSLFDPPIEEKWADEMRQNIKPINCSFVALGVTADLSGLPSKMCFQLDTPIVHCGKKFEFITVNNYAGFKGYAPEGCTAVTLILNADTYDAWKTAKADGVYAEKKAELAELVIDTLANLLPQTKDNIEVWNVATPLTYERYCGTWRGSWMSLMGVGDKRSTYPCKPESIENLYFAGQRLQVPGGVAVAAYTGRNAVQHLCRDQNTIFQGKMEEPQC
ncbi:MAG: NAD(P)/FAD-dependent oxidoreductase [Firmicutes bacterium]|nr:NAD(P)/FAD-dependent oxidoreductase [Bacillota bacterium]